MLSNISISARVGEDVMFDLSWFMVCLDGFFIDDRREMGSRGNYGYGGVRLGTDGSPQYWV